MGQLELDVRLEPEGEDGGLLSVAAVDELVAVPVPRAPVVGPGDVDQTLRPVSAMIVDW